MLMEIDYGKFTDSVSEFVLSSLRNARQFRDEGNEEEAQRSFIAADAAFTTWTLAVEQLSLANRNKETLGHDRKSMARALSDYSRTWSDL